MISVDPNIDLIETLTEVVSECSFDEHLNVFLFYFLLRTLGAELDGGGGSRPSPADRRFSEHWPGTA